MNPNKIKLFSGLAEILVNEKMITPAQADAATQSVQQYAISPLTYLVAKKIISAREIATIAAKKFNLPFWDLAQTPHTREFIPWNLIHKDFMRRTYFLPILQNNHKLSILIADPSNHQTLSEIRFYTQMPLQLYVVEIDKLIRWMSDFIELSDLSYLVEPAKFFDKKKSLSTYSSENHLDIKSNIIDFINTVLTKAIHHRVSDIHIEPQEFHFCIRWRQDGLLYEYMRLPKTTYEAVIVRLKIMAELDITERRLPQDGHFVYASTDCRMSTCPTLWGEKMVLRFLQLQKIPENIEALGLLPFQLEMIHKAIQKPQGFILVTGPTGSGKTITLYALLRLLNQANKNLVTIENPIEITLPGINQTHIHPKIGLNFSTLLRTMLRQDPDIIMVGEIRDQETAETALNAAQTGHLILSTLHTNNAVESLSRLMMMGIDPFEIAHSCSMIIAQRLARRLCSHCKILKKSEKSASFYIAHPEGCEHCHQGYQGRIGIFEILSMDPHLQTLIMQKAKTEHLAEYAKTQGMITLYEAGLRYVNQGITTQREIERVIQ